MNICVGDKIKHHPEMACAWHGPNAPIDNTSDRIYTVDEVFISAISNKLHILATAGQRHTGGPADSFIKV